MQLKQRGFEVLKGLKVLKVLLVGLALIAALGVGGCGRNDMTTQQVDKLMPEQMTNRLQLKAGEISRNVQYAADGTTKISAKVLYKNDEGKGPGKTAFIEYRTEGADKGTIKHVQLFYPAAVGQAALLAREIEIDSDGKTFTSDVIKRPDGTLEHSGRMANGIYDTVDFMLDGKSISRHRKFARVDDAWTVSFEELFFPGGRLSQTMSTQDDGSIKIDAFDDGEAHLLRSETIVNQWHTHATTERFEADGKTVSQRIEEDTYSITVDTFHAGNRVESREFSYTYGASTPVPNTMSATIYGDDGKAKFTQEWVAKADLVSAREADGNSKIDASLFNLSSVQIMNANGDVEKQISFHDDGKTLDQVTVYDNPGHLGARTEKSFRDDGTLSVVTKYDAGFNQVSTEVHAASENIVEKVDPELISARAFDSPVRTLSRFESVPE